MFSYLRMTGMAVLAAGLIGCGGGDSNSSSSSGLALPTAPTAPVTITETSAPMVAGVAVNSAMGMVANSRAAMSPLAVETPTATPQTQVLSRLTTTVMKKIVEIRNAPLSVAGVVDTFFCNGVDATQGTYTIEDNFTSVLTTFNNCQLLPDVTINGSISITNIMGDASTGSSTVNINFTIAVMGFPAVSTVGGFNYTITTIPTTQTVTMTGSNITFVNGMQVQAISNFAFSYSIDLTTLATTTSADFTLASTELGGSIVFDTLVDFQTGAGKIYPHAGEARITGAGTTILHITVLGDESSPSPHVRIDIDADGDSVIDTTNSYSWTELGL